MKNDVSTHGCSCLERNLSMVLVCLTSCSLAARARRQCVVSPHLVVLRKFAGIYHGVDVGLADGGVHFRCGAILPKSENWSLVAQVAHQQSTHDAVRRGQTILDDHRLEKTQFVQVHGSRGRHSRDLDIDGIQIAVLPTKEVNLTRENTHEV